MQEEESPIICVGSLIICCNPNVEVIPSILEPSYVVLSPLNQRFELASHQEQQFKKYYGQYLCQYLIQSCSQMIQNHLAIGLANNVKAQIYVIYLLFLSQNWCIHVNTE